MIKTTEQAHAELADALWWLRGFEAAASSDQEGVVRALWSGLREVRDYLDRLTEAKVRRLGDEKAIVLTYAEFEAIYDYVGHLNANEEEKGRAVVTCRTVLDQFREEATAARNLPEIPF